MVRYLSTQCSNNKPANQRGGKTGDTKKDDESKSEDKDIITGNTIGVYIEDTTTTEESTPPSGTLSIGAHVSETNIQLSNSSRTVEETLGANPVDDDDFWCNTNPIDVSIYTANSEEMMVESPITKFHISEQEELVTTELLNKESNVPGLTCKHDAGGGHHNQSNQRSAKLTDYKLNTCEDGSFSSGTVRKKDVVKVMGKTLNMAEGFINDMLPKSSRLQAPTIVEHNNKTTNRNEIRDSDPTAVSNKDNDCVEHVNTILNPNNILDAHVMEEKEEWFYQCANNYNVWNSESYPSTEDRYAHLEPLFSKLTKYLSKITR